jgi:hypothetical protein
LAGTAKHRHIREGDRRHVTLRRARGHAGAPWGAPLRRRPRAAAAAAAAAFLAVAVRAAALAAAARARVAAVVAAARGVSDG